LVPRRIEPIRTRPVDRRLRMAAQHGVARRRKLAGRGASRDAGRVSYLHCPTCRCAYNIATQPACPRCGVRAGTPADAADDVVAAAEQLARALARATPAQLAAAEATLDARAAQHALPAANDPIAPAPAAPPSLLRAVRAALAPRSPVVPAGSRGHQALLTTVVIALLTRVAAPPRSRRAWVASQARALLAR
jgi:hypothetical protein